MIFGNKPGFEKKRALGKGREKNRLRGRFGRKRRRRGGSCTGESLKTTASKQQA